jgi:hypothetical protein
MGDQGDGTYTNPILPGDHSDIVLHSKDLVNWSILGHVVEDLTQIGPELNWDAMDRYGKGIWAPAIRYHNRCPCGSRRTLIHENGRISAQRPVSRSMCP